MKNKFWHFILSILLLILNCGGSCTGFAENKNVITIGLDIDVPPVGFLDPKGNITGFDVELAEETFKAIGKTVKFQAINWDAK